MTYLRAIKLLTLTITLSGCATSFVVKSQSPVELPPMRNSPDQCYYVDNFLPLANNVLTGRQGKFAIRYYFYKTANYKGSNKAPVILSFYSDDEKCWTLFEEFTDPL